MLPEQIADTIIVVGDQKRVEDISKNFDQIDYKVQNREFVTHTGSYKGKKITALSTGIGIDNIDIVLNELDALVNIDLKKRVLKEEHHSLNIVRLGTCGALQEDIPVDSFAVSQYALGLDGLLNFYDYKKDEKTKEIENEIREQMQWNEAWASPYVFQSDKTLFKLLSQGNRSGITATAPGFYGPQGRVLRLKLKEKDINQRLHDFNYQGLRMVNFEMESSALFGLSHLLGHRACTICAVIANRFNQTFSEDYHPVVNKLIQQVLGRLSQL